MAARSRCDRGAIAVRSHRDRDVLPGALCAVRLESDAPDVFQKKQAKIQLLVAVGSRSRGLKVDEDKPSPVATWRPVSLSIDAT